MKLAKLVVYSLKPLPVFAINSILYALKGLTLLLGDCRLKYSSTKQMYWFKPIQMFFISSVILKVSCSIYFGHTNFRSSEFSYFNYFKKVEVCGLNAESEHYKRTFTRKLDMENGGKR